MRFWDSSWLENAKAGAIMPSTCNLSWAPQVVHGYLRHFPCWLHAHGECIVLNFCAFLISSQDICMTVEVTAITHELNGENDETASLFLISARKPWHSLYIVINWARSEYHGIQQALNPQVPNHQTQLSHLPLYIAAVRIWWSASCNPWQLPIAMRAIAFCGPSIWEHGSKSTISIGGSDEDGSSPAPCCGSWRNRQGISNIELNSLAYLLSLPRKWSHFARWKPIFWISILFLVHESLWFLCYSGELQIRLYMAAMTEHWHAWCAWILRRKKKMQNICLCTSAIVNCAMTVQSHIAWLIRDMLWIWSSMEAAMIES